MVLDYYENTQKFLCATTLPWSQASIDMTHFENYLKLLKIFQYCSLFSMILLLPNPQGQAFFDILTPHILH